MSRVMAVVALGSAGDVHPNVGLGTEEDYHAAIQDPDIWSPYRAFAVVARRLIVPIIAGVFEILSQWSRTGDVVAAAFGLAFAARRFSASRTCSGFCRRAGFWMVGCSRRTEQSKDRLSSRTET